MHARLTTKGAKELVGNRLPVTIYYQEKGVVIRFSTGVTVEISKWDEKKMLITGSDEQTKRTNDLLRKMLGRANQIISYCHFNEVPITRVKFGEDMKKSESRDTAVLWIEEQINQDYERGLFAKATLYMKLRLVKRLNLYDAGATWADMTREWLDKFDVTMAREFAKKDSDGVREREKMMKYLKGYFLRAKDSGKVVHDMWRGFKIRKSPSRLVYMNEREMTELELLYDDSLHLEQRMRDWAAHRGMQDDRADQYVSQNADDVRRHIRNFLFQCYSGVRVSDAQRLRTDEIEGEYIVFTPHKTRNVSGKQVRLPITSKMRKYMSTERTGRILPGIGSAQKYNEGLKPVAWMIGTRKTMTTHVARHTFATMAVAGGVSLISLRDLLGVTSVKTVEIYAHSSQEQQEREMLRAFEK